MVGSVVSNVDSADRYVLTMIQTYYASTLSDALLRTTRALLIRVERDTCSSGKDPVVRYVVRVEDDNREVLWEKRSVSYTTLMTDEVVATLLLLLSSGTSPGQS